MATVYLSLGSNIAVQDNITAALDGLEDEFGTLQISSVYESESVGFSGDNFFNLVVGVRTATAVGEISQCLKRLENSRLRDRTTPKFSARTLDIDILCVDDLYGSIDGIDLPRDEILKNAFVLLPLSEIAGDRLHPLTGVSYAQHWHDYDKHRQKLWPVDFVWRGGNITRVGN
jgi:2-amino-4-hydroxy-6-hydroxymethyldihydropteridine diphosphokinase